MKKFFVIALLMSSVAMHAMDDVELEEEIILPEREGEAQYKSPFIERAGYYAAPIAGGLLGSRGVGEGGYWLGKLDRNITIPKGKLYKGVVAKKDYSDASFYLEGIGNIVGFSLGVAGGRYAMLAVIAKRYGVSQRVAMASQFTGLSLANKEIKKIFLEAEKQNEKSLKRYLSKYYSLRFGKDWENIVRELLSEKDGEAVEKYVEAKLPARDASEAEGARPKLMKQFQRAARWMEKRDTRNQLDSAMKKTLPLTYALSKLYFNDPFYKIKGELLIFRRLRHATKKLFDELFGEK